MAGHDCRLFRLVMEHPDTVTYLPSEWLDDNYHHDPMTPPGYLIGGLPDEIAEQVARLGAAWSNDPYADLSAAGVEVLEWRYPLRHVEGQLVSDDVFAALSQLLPGQIHSDQKFLIDSSNKPRSAYHRFRVDAWPSVGYSSPGWNSLIAWDECEPSELASASGRGLMSVEFAKLSKRLGGLTFAVPRWLDRDDRVLQDMVVTESFRDRWLRTEISKFLRGEQWEIDVGFFEPALLRLRYAKNVSYRWVDVPVPEGIER